ncbi:MAG: ribosome hibernation-promoting factor, HPF/YfiA family [Hyphomicrobiales bacterium]
MDIKITGKNIDVGDALRAQIDDRLSHDVSKYFDGIVDGHVTVHKEASTFRSECTLHLSTGIVLQAEGQSSDAYASFDQAATRLQKRVRRYKRRLKDHHARRGAKPIDSFDAPYYVIAREDDSADEPEDLNPPIIAENISKVRDLSVGEAVMQLDLSDSPVIVFRNGDKGGINIVYRRGDGNIGWIDAEAGNS